MSTTLFAPLTASASIRGIWCEAEATHNDDEYGPFTSVDIFYATSEGEPLAEFDIDGHLTQGELHALLSDLSRGSIPDGVDVAWVGTHGSVA